MGLGGVFFEGEDGWGLTMADVDPLINRFHQQTLPVNKIVSVQIRRNDPICQKDGLFRTSLFTKAAEDAAKHIDLINGGIFLFPVEIQFIFLPLGGYHGNRLGRTGKCAKSAGGTAFPALIIPFQHMHTTIDFRPGFGDFRVLKGRLFTEKMANGYAKSLKNGRQVNTFGKSHLFV